MDRLKKQILEAALPAIVFDGWTMSTLEHAAQKAGLSPIDAKRAFPGGAAEALEFFHAEADAAMLEMLNRDYKLSEMKIRERIATAVMVRLRHLLPHREAVRRATGFYLLPSNRAAGAKALYHTVDTIWHAAGDTSTDYNFYTKRLLLAGVLTSTTRIWLEDKSKNLADTQAFLHRRIENVMQIEKAKGKLRARFSKPAYI